MEKAISGEAVWTSFFKLVDRQKPNHLSLRDFPQILLFFFLLREPQAVSQGAKPYEVPNSCLVQTASLQDQADQNFMSANASGPNPRIVVYIEHIKGPDNGKHPR
jgi:hypothetical protein